MRLALVVGVIGQQLRLFSLAFLAPLGLAVIDGKHAVAGHFAVALALGAGAGSLMARGFARPRMMRRSEAMAVVAGTWLVVALFAAVPYMFTHLGLVNSLFESMSGLTSTGATILQGNEDPALDDWIICQDRYGRPFWLWRAMTQWFGGLGVIALFVVILPRLGIAGRQLFFAEASTATAEGISPKVRESARKLWRLYILLTAILAGLLIVTGFQPYDALVHALTTMSAGGFSPNPSSIQGYANPTAEWIFVVFMILSGTSFTLQWRAFSGHPTAFFRDGEFMAYLGFMVVISLLLAAMLAGGLPDIHDLRTSAFQVTSLTSSTGYASVDFEQWQSAPKILLLVVMLIGGCAGSACGGPKVIRYLLLYKFLRREMTQVLHPNAVISLRYKGRIITLPVMRAVITLVVLYLAGYLLLGVVLIAVGETADMVTGMSVSLACFGNIGPAFGFAGPMGSYASFSDGGKLLLLLSMWLGRLEIVTVLALLHPHVWRGVRWRDPD